jgi:hypothetical protein
MSSMTAKTTFDVMVDVMTEEWDDIALTPGLDTEDRMARVLKRALEEAGDTLPRTILAGAPRRARVILFKASGKYYTEEWWRIPDNAIGPHDMKWSKDFRRIDGGAVLVDSQEPWGYPHLFPKEG